MWLQTQVTCSVAADHPHSIKTLHPQVFKLRAVSPVTISKFVILNKDLGLLKQFHVFSLFSSTDYFSLKSWSHPSSPSHSPTPSIAGSCTSSSESARRRPLISPARLNITRQRLWIFSTEPEPKLFSTQPASPSYSTVGPDSPVYSGRFSPDIPPFQSQNGESTFGMMTFEPKSKWTPSLHTLYSKWI